MSGGNVVKLSRPAPDVQVVECLETLLEKAKAGEIHEIAVCALGEENCVWSVMAGEDKHVFTMYGGISMLAHEYRERNIE